MKPTRPLLAAAGATLILAGCSHTRSFYDPDVRRLQPDVGPPHLPVAAATVKHTDPKPLPLVGVLLEIPSGKTVRGVEDLVVHARREENDDSGSGKDDGIGFTGLISTPDPDLKKRPAPENRRPYEVGMKASEVKVAMPIGFGIFRGLRPRLTTAIISGGAEGSTVIAWAMPTVQWIYLAQYTVVGGKYGSVDLLAPNGTPTATKEFSDIKRLIIAEKDSTTGQWFINDAVTLDSEPKIKAMCEEGWKRAQDAKVIPPGEVFPSPP
jgi:hypothetical protein